MFLRGFHKVAATLVTLTPDEYYDVVRRKDPYVGALAGGVIGAGVGAIKGSSGTRSSKALLGAALGSGAGSALGYLSGKAVKNWQANRIYRMTTDLNLKSTPSRSHGSIGG